MTLNHITILNYKNIKEAELDFSPNINCFVGTNGEGKTNVLDAIYFLSFTKSATNAIDSQNVRHGEEFFMIQGQYELNGNMEEVSCGLKLHQKKQFKRNKKAYAPASRGKPESRSEHRISVHYRCPRAGCSCRDRFSRNCGRPQVRRRRTSPSCAPSSR